MLIPNKLFNLQAGALADITNKANLAILSTEKKPARAGRKRNSDEAGNDVSSMVTLFNHQPVFSRSTKYSLRFIYLHTAGESPIGKAGADEQGFVRGGGSFHSSGC